MCWPAGKARGVRVRPHVARHLAPATAQGRCGPGATVEHDSAAGWLQTHFVAVLGLAVGAEQQPAAAVARWDLDGGRNETGVWEGRSDPGGVAVGCAVAGGTAGAVDCLELDCLGVCEGLGELAREAEARCRRVAGLPRGLRARRPIPRRRRRDCLLGSQSIPQRTGVRLVRRTWTRTGRVRRWSRIAVPARARWVQTPCGSGLEGFGELGVDEVPPVAPNGRPLRTPCHHRQRMTTRFLEECRAQMTQPRRLFPAGLSRGDAYAV